MSIPWRPFGISFSSLEPGLRKVHATKEDAASTTRIGTMLDWMVPEMVAGLSATSKSMMTEWLELSSSTVSCAFFGPPES